MKRIISLLSVLFLLSCQNANTVSPVSSPSPSISPSESPNFKYTREDYIRIFTCTLEIQGNDKLTPANRGKIAAHLALVKNDSVWNIQKNTPETYINSVETISKPLGCN
ncbi:MAG: hypothetical protein U0354_17125 [Candidatus Sericytochromatia bacterium]